MTFEPVSLDPLPPEERPAPLPIGGGPAPTGPVVEGILCSREHFNDPRARYCCACGISMVHQTHIRVRQPRPPVGVLVLDDGATFVVDGDYVLGREPHTHALVAEQRARPLLIDDPSLKTSRAHVHIAVDGWDVHAVDLGSSNGTHVAAHKVTEWTALVAGVPAPLGPGTELLVGGRRLVFESHHRAAVSGGPKR